MNPLTLEWAQKADGDYQPLLVIVWLELHAEIAAAIEVAGEEPALLALQGRLDLLAPFERELAGLGSFGMHRICPPIAAGITKR